VAQDKWGWWGGRSGGFRWWHLGLFVLPLSMFVYITTIWAPGHEPVVGPPDGPFFVGTILLQDRFALPDDPDALQSPSDAILAATCHNYDDWLDDATLNPDLVIVEPDDGLLRSAELLDGEVELTDAVLEAERLVSGGWGSGRVLAEMRSDDWSSTELADAERYLDARRTPPSPGADERYVFYLANETTKSLLLARLEVDVDHERRYRTSGTTGDISVALPDGSIVAVNESRCWR
jgi:hypothetical protein